MTAFVPLPLDRRQASTLDAVSGTTGTITCGQCGNQQDVAAGDWVFQIDDTSVMSFQCSCGASTTFAYHDDVDESRPDVVLLHALAANNGRDKKLIRSVRTGIPVVAPKGAT